MSFATGFQAGLTDRQRAAENARADELHAMKVAQYRRQVGLQAEEDAAFKSYDAASAAGGMSPEIEAQVGQRYGLNPGQIKAAGTGLQSQLNARDAEFDRDLDMVGAPTTATGQPMRESGIDVEGAKQRNLLAARQRINVAQRNPAAMAAGEAEGRGIDREGKLRKTAQMIQNPLFRQQLDGLINSRSSRVTLARAKDGKGNETGPYIATVVAPDGKGNVIPLSDTDYLQLAHAHVLAEEGDVASAGALLRAVNKDIADALDNSDRKTMDVAKFNQTGEHQQAVLDQSARQHSERMGLQRQQNPVLSPESRKELMELQRRYAEAAEKGDTRGAAVIERQIQQTMARVSLSDLGRPMALPNYTNKVEVTFADFADRMQPNQPSSIPGPNGRPKLNKDLTLQEVMQEYQAFMNRGQGGANGGIDLSAVAEATKKLTSARSAQTDPAEGQVIGGLPVPPRAPVDMRAEGYNVRPQNVAPEPPRPTGTGGVLGWANDAPRRYLEGKIQRGERLDPAEQVRAQRLGLIN